MRRLLQYPWPGNVRELRNCLESLVILSRQAHDRGDRPPSYLQSPAAADEFTIRVGTPLAAVEQEVIRHTLASVPDQNRGGRLLRIGRRTLQRKLKGYGLA